MKELDALISKLTAEETDLGKKLEAVKEKKRVLLAAFSGAASKPKAPSKKPGKTAKRAPKGALTNAVKLALATTPGISNKEIREALQKSNYPHPFTPLHVSKTLGVLVASGEITKTDADGRRTYAVAPAKE